MLIELRTTSDLPVPRRWEVGKPLLDPGNTAAFYPIVPDSWLTENWECHGMIPTGGARNIDTNGELME
jgi:hypothetical protein